METSEASPAPWLVYLGIHPGTHGAPPGAGVGGLSHRERPGPFSVLQRVHMVIKFLFQLIPSLALLRKTQDLDTLRLLLEGTSPPQTNPGGMIEDCCLW